MTASRTCSVEDFVVCGGDENKARTPLEGYCERHDRTKIYCCTASRVWVHGVLARLQVLLGGMVICHIRFSTTPDTMVVVYIGLRFFPYEIAFHHFAIQWYALTCTAS